MRMCVNEPASTPETDLRSEISNRKSQRSCFPAIAQVFAAAILFACFTAPVPALAESIEFFPTLDAVKEAHPDDPRARVIVFGSQTCGWCRKLAADTLANPIVEESAECFLWIKVDVDEYEDLAAQYGVRGLPHTVVADEHGNMLGEQPGYLPAQEFIDFLMTSLTQPAPSASELLQLLADLKSDGERARRGSVRTLMERVSRIDSTGRDQAIETLAGLEADQWAEFVPYLSHPRLAMRATAHGLLTRSSPADLPFDPFSPAAAREGQIAAWTAWMQEHGATVPPLELPPTPAESSGWSPDQPPPPPVATPLAIPAEAAE